MQFRRLKELAKKLGGILVLDGDEPGFVILPYSSYEKIDSEDVPVYAYPKNDGLANGNGKGRAKIDDYDDQETVEKLNQEIFALKEEIRAKEEAELQSGEFAESVENEQPA